MRGPDKKLEAKKFESVRSLQHCQCRVPKVDDYKDIQFLNSMGSVKALLVDDAYLCAYCRVPNIRYVSVPAQQAIQLQAALMQH